MPDLLGRAFFLNFNLWTVDFNLKSDIQLYEEAIKALKSYKDDPANYKSLDDIYEKLENMKRVDIYVRAYDDLHDDFLNFLIYWIMKNAYDWFSLLTPQDAMCARSYIDPQRFDNLYESLKDALSKAFVWENTPQGWNYWKKIAEKL